MEPKQRRVVFINFRARSDGDEFMCWLPMHELFMAKALQEYGGARSIEIYTLYTHEDAKDYLDQWRGADIFVCWETYARSFRFVQHHFALAKTLKQTFNSPVLFGGYWPTVYGESYDEFQVFDTLICGYAIDEAAEIINQGPNERFIREAHGPSAYDKYELDLSFLRTNLEKYVLFDVLQGYFSSFGCPKRCSFCINDLYQNLGSQFCPRSADQIKRDIDTLNSHIPFKAINFKDSNFFYDLDRAEECLNYVKLIGKEINYNLDITVRDAVEEFFRRIGVLCSERHFFFGLESFIPEERKIFGKPYSEEELEAFFERAKRFRFNISGNLMFGFPFQSKESILQEVCRAIVAMRAYPNLTIYTSAYIPKAGTGMQKNYFPDLHSRLTFEQLISVYHSNAEHLQDVIYGDQFKGINFAMLNKGFTLLLAIKLLRQHLPLLAQPFLELINMITTRHVLKGATNPIVNAILRPLNITKTRRVLTRAGIRYKKFLASLSKENHILPCKEHHE